MDYSQMIVLAQESGDAAAGIFGGLMGLACCAILYFGLTWLLYYKLFEKAGETGWHCLVPILNAIILLKIAGRPAWWVILLLIPFVGAVIGIIMCLDIARKFGQSTGFAVGLILLGFVFFPILGFGSATYNKTA